MRCDFLGLFPASPFLYYSQQDVYNICICSLFFTMTGFGDTSTTKISMYMSKISGHAPPSLQLGGGRGGGRGKNFRYLFQWQYGASVWDTQVMVFPVNLFRSKLHVMFPPLLFRWNSQVWSFFSSSLGIKTFFLKVLKFFCVVLMNDKSSNKTKIEKHDGKNVFLQCVVSTSLEINYDSI